MSRLTRSPFDPFLQQKIKKESRVSRDWERGVREDFLEKYVWSIMDSLVCNLGNNDVFIQMMIRYLFPKVRAEGETAKIGCFCLYEYLKNNFKYSQKYALKDPW